MIAQTLHLFSTISLLLLVPLLMVWLYMDLFTDMPMNLSKRLYCHGLIKLISKRGHFVRYYQDLMIVELAIIKNLFYFAWCRDQYFEHSLHAHGGHVTLYEACELAYPTETAALQQRAQRHFTSMLHMLEPGLIIPRFTLRVCYFDRTFGGLDDMIWFWCSVKDQQLGPVQCEIEEGQAAFEQPCFEQLAHLSRFPLQQGQYFTHFYRKGQDPDYTDSETLALVHIVDTFGPLLQRKKRKELMDTLRIYITTGSPYRRIAICYRPRHFNTLQYTFYYDI